MSSVEIPRNKNDEIRRNRGEVSSEEESVGGQDSKEVKNKEEEREERKKEDKHLKEIKERLDETALFFKREILNTPRTKEERSDPEKWKHYLEKRTSNIGYFEKFPSFSYSVSEVPLIRKIFFQLKGEIDALSKKKDVRFENSNLTHLLGNGPYYYFALAKREITNIDNRPTKSDMEAAKGDPEIALNRREVKFPDDTKTAYTGFPRLRQNKFIWDKFLYYIDRIGDVKNREILEKEVNSSAGYLDKFKEYYKERERTVNGELVRERDIVEGSLARLDHFNFFMRLDEKMPDSPIMQIPSVKEISKPILTQKDFEKIFEGLAEKEKLDKDKIYQDLFLCKKVLT